MGEDSGVGRPQNPTFTPRKRCSEEQIIYALRSVDAGAKIGEVCRQLGVAEQTYYRWKKQSDGFGVSERRRRKQLEDNSRKRLVADLSLDKRMRQEVLAKKVCGLRASARSWTG